jgi:hypothetical protein
MKNTAAGGAKENNVAETTKGIIEAGGTGTII